MLKKYIILFFVLFACKLVLGQVYLYDKQDMTPIPFAHFIAGGGALLTTTNINGKAKTGFLSKLSNRDSIVIQHISYKNFSASHNDLKNVDTLYLDKNSFKLPEVAIKVKRPEILVLKGYYRVYMLADNTPAYYTDGIIEYYINLIKNKTVSHQVLSHRTFYNIQTPTKLKNNYQIEPPGIPSMKQKTIIDNLKEGHTIVSFSEEKQYVKSFDSLIVGSIISNDSINIEVSIDMLDGKKERTFSFMQIEDKTVEWSIIENYAYKDDLKISKKNILSQYEYIKSYTKHKKEIDTLLTEGFREFYLQNKKYITYDEFKNLRTSKSKLLLKSHNYKEEYWKTLDHTQIPDINPNIQKLFGTTLEMYPALNSIPLVEEEEITGIKDASKVPSKFELFRMLFKKRKKK